MTTPSDTLTIALPEQLDLTAAPSLHRLLRESLDTGGELALDAEAVGVVTSPCLQVLAAAAITQRGRGKALRIVAASPAFRVAVEDLDLAQVLPLPAAAG